MKKYYAVKNGRETGIFEDWTSCEKQIKGFPNAAFKSFKTRSEAEEYLLAFQKKPTLTDKTADRYPCAYIDGSYDPVSHRFAYGVVILLSDEKRQEFCGAFDDAGLARMRNVAGEIKASEFAIQYALDQGWPHLSVYYDYNGIEKWATGEWKRNLPATQDYHAFCQNAFQYIDVSFFKVQGHSGDTYNDLADSLARRALDL